VALSAPSQGLALGRGSRGRGPKWHPAGAMRARQGYPYEALLLVLVAFATLGFFYKLNWQDISRLALTQSVALDGTLHIDRWAEQTGDKARFDDHFYSDKAPGLSFAALPAFEALHATGVVRRNEERFGVWNRPIALWLTRLATAGALFLVAVFLVGRAAERAVPGTGAPVAASFGLGTLAAPLAAISMSHVAAGALAFGGFLLAWRAPDRIGPVAAAGLCAGAALLVEYQTVLAGIVVLVYVAARTRRPASVLAYAAGYAPGWLALGAYDLGAFGSPLHLSYRYVTGFVEQQRHGFFGIGIPTAHGIAKTLVAPHGLLLESPVLLLAAAGLALLWRRGLRAEAVVCAAVTLAFALSTAGYFDPYGGTSPGPRFFVPALPFLTLGLAPAYARWPRVTALAALVSVGAMLYECATWAAPDDDRWTSVTAWSYWAGTPKSVGLALAAVAAAGALALAALVMRRGRIV
jgi:hypothetical protein